MASVEEQSAVTVESEDMEVSSSAQRDDGLPTSFDVIIVGTGLTESILSAAVSRNGHAVLHIDPRDYYGGAWATFSFDQWTSSSLVDIPKEAVTEVDVRVNGKEGRINWRNDIDSFQQVWYNSNEDTQKELMSQKRRFNIDVMPKLIAAREDIVELLITSNVSRYLEFLRISKILTNLPSPKTDVIEPIPLSRADIFTSKSLTLVEKRGLVKLIEAVLQHQKSEKDKDEADPNPEPIPETFEELVKTTKVSEKVQHMVKASVTVLEDGFSPDGESLNHEFFGRCRLFLNSIGRYGNQTPFLWALYGISEICQAFCRLSAVYGGIYILKRHLSKIESTPEGFVVTSEEDKIKAKHVILGPEMTCIIHGEERSKKEHASIRLGRAVLVTKGGNITPPDNVTKSKGDGIFVYRISGVEVIEMNHTSQAVPRNYRLLQISFPILERETAESNCRQQVEQIMSPFLEFQHKDEPPASLELSGPTEGDINQKPQVIYGSYFVLNFTCDSLSSELFSSDRENNSTGFIMQCSTVSSDLSCYVSKARQIFSTLYPNEEFLPKAPDCEGEGVMNGDDDAPAIEAVEDSDHSAIGGGHEVQDMDTDNPEGVPIIPAENQPPVLSTESAPETT